jgi:glycosyltransferase involved in cell wall biosynthesis
MEYLSMEKPVIVTDIEAHRTVIDSNETGMFIPSNDPADIAKGILRAYHEQRRFPVMGREGRKRIRDQFTWEKQAFRLNQYLRAVMHDERFPVMGG